MLKNFATLFRRQPNMPVQILVDPLLKLLVMN